MDDSGSKRQYAAFVVIGLSNIFLKVAAIHFSFDEDGGMVGFSVSKQSDVVEILQWVEIEDSLDVGDCLVVLFGDFADDDFAEFAFADFFEVEMEVTFGAFGDAGRVELACLEERRGEAGEQEKSLHNHREYAGDDEKVTAF
jgi:hypothetical protein